MGFQLGWTLLQPAVDQEFWLKLVRTTSNLNCRSSSNSDFVVPFIQYPKCAYDPYR